MLRTINDQNNTIAQLTTANEKMQETILQLENLVQSLKKTIIELENETTNMKAQYETSSDSNSPPLVKK